MRLLGKQLFSFGKGTTITLINDKFICFLDYDDCCCENDDCYGDNCGW